MPSLGVLFDLDSVGFPREIDVAVMANHSFGLIGCLGHSGGFGEGIGSYRCGLVEILARQILGPDSGGLLSGVIALRYFFLDLIIRLLLPPSPSTMLYNQLLILFSQRGDDSILCPHDFSTNGVLIHALCVVKCFIGGIKASLLLLCLLLCNFSLNFLSDLSHDLFYYYPITYLLFCSQSFFTGFR